MIHFARLTLADGQPVYINCDMVAAVYAYKKNGDDAVVQFVGDEDNYIHVIELVETTMDIIRDAMRG